MANYDGLCELRLYYTTTPVGEDPMDHVHTIDVKLQTPLAVVGSSFDDFPAVRRSGVVDSLQEVWDEYENLIAALFSNTTNFIRVELWVAAEGSHDFTFYSVYAIGHAGDTVGGAVAAQQATLTLRSQSGGIMRLQYMEPSTSGNAKDPYPFASTPGQALAVYMSGVTSPFLARDNSYPIAPINFSQTQNEKLYRKRYR